MGNTPPWALPANSYKGQFSSYPSLPATANDGDRADIPQLVGNDRIRLHYVAAQSRWAVDVGRTIATALDPCSVVSGAAGNYDQAFCFIPVGMWGEGEEWEFAQPTESGSSNTGSIISRIFLGAYESNWGMVASRRDAANIRFVRRSNNPRRTYLTIGGAVDNGLGYTYPDMSVPLEYRHRLTINNAGDSAYIVHSHIKRHA